MQKKAFTNLMKNWLVKFLNKKYSATHKILDVVIPNTNLARLSDSNIKSCKNYSAWEFRPDILGILKNKKNAQIELVLLNRSISAISLKEIGEIYCYSKLVNSKISFLASLKGVSNEVNILLVDDSIRSRLLKYSDNGQIIIFSWDEKKGKINENSIIPTDKNNFLLK
ncbi:hypothetical protein ES703_108030 [subsurface metagenome]